jgi:hypothetical protein
MYIIPYIQLYARNVSAFDLLEDRTAGALSGVTLHGY